MRKIKKLPVSSKKFNSRRSLTLATSNSKKAFYVRNPKISRYQVKNKKIKEEQLRNKSQMMFLN